MPQHGQDEPLEHEPLTDAEIALGEKLEAERVEAERQLAREQEAAKLTGTDRAMHDARRALVARGFKATDMDETEFEHSNGSAVSIAPVE